MTKYLMDNLVTHNWTNSTARTIDVYGLFVEDNWLELMMRVSMRRIRDKRQDWQQARVKDMELLTRDLKFVNWAAA